MTRHGKGVVITALGITQILAWGASYYLLAVLAVPIVDDTGWPMPWVVGGLSVGLIVAGLLSPRIGRAIGERGGRPVLATSSVLLGIGLSVLGLSPSLPVYLAGWLVIGVGMGAGLYDAAFATLGVLYREKARSAISQLTLWGGFASTACWPLSALLVEQLGWRGTCFAYAGIQLGFSLPVLLVALRSERTWDIPLGPTHAATVALTEPEERAFLILRAVMVLGGITTSVVSVHVITLLQERGLTLASAVALGALIGPSQVAARVVEMATGGRHHPFWTLAWAMALIAAGIALLWIGFPLPAAALVLYGTGNGIYSIARGALPLTLFGPDRYPAISGRLAGPSLLAQALAPSMAAFVLARFGASWTYAALGGVAIVNLTLVAFLWPLTRSREASPS